MRWLSYRAYRPKKIQYMQTGKNWELAQNMPETHKRFFNFIVYIAHKKDA